MAALIPFVVFSAILVNWLVENERAPGERRLKRNAQYFALSVDREMTASIKALEIIAQSETLRRRDLRGFHHAQRRILKLQPSWLTVILHAPDERLILDALHPYGEKLKPALEPGSLREAVATGKPVIGAIVRGEPDGKLANNYAFAIRVPVIEDGKIIFALSAIVSGDVLQNIATETASEFTDEWVRSLIDSKGIIAARTRFPDQAIGKPATPDFMKVAEGSPEGVVQQPSLEGRPLYISYSRLPTSGWMAAVGVPVDVVEAKANYAQRLVTTVGFFLLIIFGGIALIYSRRLALKFRMARDGAIALGRDEVPDIQPSRIAEVEQLGGALLSASDLLRKRDAERKENLAHAKAAQAEAEKAVHAKTEFLANMSHELRTPLGIIIGILDLLSNPQISPQEKASLNVRIRRNAEYLSALIDQILDLSKVEANALQIEIRPFSLKELLEDLAYDMETKTRAKGITLKFETRGPVPETVHSDPLRLRQILTNIVDNAVKFTDAGGVSVIASAILPTSSERKMTVLEFLVEDTGIGISPENQTKLFQRFSQGDSTMTRRFGGTGLGLVFSKRVAQALGGDIELVKSEPLNGSSFKITIQDGYVSQSKFIEIVPQEAGPNSEITTSHRRDRPLSDQKILLVDDSEDTRFLIKRFLDLAGAQVSEAANGLEAVDTATSNNFVCIVMDIQMPVMDGNQAAAELRKRGYTKPILAITAHAMKTDKDHALRSGYTEYVTKPVDKVKLIEILSSFMG